MVIIKKPRKRGGGSAVPPAGPTPPTFTAGVGNPIFDSDATVYAEAKRQLKLIDDQLNTKTKDGKQQNLLHVLRGILDADRRGIVIRTANREEFLSVGDATIPQTEQLLVELEQADYLEITTRRQKNHDYRASQKAYDTWNSIRLYEGISPMRPARYGPQRSEDHYLVPFDSKTYLDRVRSGIPRDLPVSFSGFHLVPCQEGTIGVGVERDYRATLDHKLVLLDLRDHELQPGDYKTPYHEQLYRYVGIPALGSKLDAVLAEVPGRRDTLVPRYGVKNEPRSSVDTSVIFRDTRGQHYQVPEQFLFYLYNNYFGDDLDIRVSGKPVGIGGYQGSWYGATRSGQTHDIFLIVVSRCGSKQPLLLYRFEQIREQLATIT